MSATARQWVVAVIALLLGAGAVYWLMANERSELAALVSATETRLDGASEELAALTDQLTAGDAEQGALKDELAGAADRIVALEAQLVERDAKLATVSTENTDRRSEIAALDRELAAANNRISALESELAAAGQEKAELEGDLAEASKRATILTAELAGEADDNVGADPAGIRSGDRTGVLLGQLEDLNEQVTALRDELAAAEMRAAEFETETAAGAERIVALETELAAATERIAALEADLTAGNRQIAAFQAEQNAATEKLAVLEDQRAEADQAAAALQRELADAEARLATLEPEFQALQDVADTASEVADQRAVERRAVELCRSTLNRLVEAEPLLFQTRSAAIDDLSEATLDKVATIIGQCPSARIEVAGHADSVGLHSFNMVLSHQRAQTVIDYLTQTGTEIDSLYAVGYGPTQPVASNDTDEGRSRNRRVEFVVR